MSFPDFFFLFYHCLCQLRKTCIIFSIMQINVCLLETNYAIYNRCIIFSSIELCCVKGSTRIVTLNPLRLCKHAGVFVCMCISFVAFSIFSSSFDVEMP